MTRAHIQVIGRYEWYPDVDNSVLLHVGTGGYPENVVPVVADLAEFARGLVTAPPCPWWEASTVASLMVAWSVNSGHRKASQLPEDVNGSEWGVPYICCMSMVDDSVSWWYSLELEKNDDNPPQYDWHLWVYDLRGIQIGDDFSTDDMSPTAKGAESVDGGMTLFMPEKKSYTSEEVIARFFPGPVPTTEDQH